MTDNDPDTLAFIGGGNMAKAIAGGLVDSGYDATRLVVSEPDEDAVKKLARDLPGARVTRSNAEAAAAADCMVLAVKPQVLPAVCTELAATVQRVKPLVVSIAAGVRCDDIDRWLGGGLALVRVMPNQPALLRRGVSGLYANDRATAADRERASAIMRAVGDVVEVDSEDAIDVVTAVSGSGPAYFFLLIDMLRSSAIELGLDESAAKRLALGAATGAAALAAQADEDMATLIARVRSPGGTTEAALDRLDEGDVRGIFAAAIKRARDRAIELADAAHASTPAE